VTAFAAGYREYRPLTDAQLADAVHRLWRDRVGETWHLRFHYERHEPSCDYLFGCLRAVDVVDRES
jgi:hypothetical protein